MICVWWWYIFKLLFYVNSVMKTLSQQYSVHPKLLYYDIYVNQLYTNDWLMSDVYISFDFLFIIIQHYS